MSGPPPVAMPALQSPALADPAFAAAAAAFADAAFDRPIFDRPIFDQPAFDRPIFDGPGPRLFCVAPGADFAQALAAGLRARLAGRPPEALARVEITVSTRRGRRAIEAAFEAQGGPATFLPRIRPLALIGADPAEAPDLPPAIEPTRRLLALTRLVAAWLAADAGRAPQAAAPALAASLARLIDDFDREGLDLAALDDAAPEHARHWDRALDFLRILREHWPAIRADAGGALDPEARRRLAVEAQRAGWRDDPPRWPVIAAGSTGSVGTTARLLEAVASLPDGAVVLPGFDPALAADIWDRIGPDHPWSAFRRLLDRLGAAPGDVRPWVAPDPAFAPRRRLVAEALRPAPATDGWMEARAGLAAEAPEATAGLSLIEAPDPRREAAAIAVALREAVAEGRSAALVTPDRTLARRVAAALARWGIEPDDSGGRPLGLTPPGVFLRLIAEIACGPFAPAALLGLLKHPLMAAGPGRAAHLAAARRFELRVLRRFPALPDLAACRAALAARAAAEAEGLSLIDDEDDGDERRPAPAPADSAAGSVPDGAPDSAADRAAEDAVDAILARLAALAEGAGRSLADRAAAHLAAAEDFAGPALWAQAAGEAARAATDRFLAAADAYGPCPAAAYPALFAAALAGAEAREEAFRPDPRVMIWGPLEARMQGADLLILGGLAEGVWPAAPDPGPWLGREMRARVGLPALETRLGLAAHDVLQAACAPRAILTRSLRSGEAPAAPSRWLARLTTLLAGVAPQALSAMRDRGARFATLAAALERADADRAATPPAGRPHPRPPVAHRPAELWATQIQTLIRDPYAVYARHVLGLHPLDPVGRGLDARDRGVALHEALARFARATLGWDPDRPPGDWDAALAEAGEAAWAARAAPPALRRLWRARLTRLAPAFLAEEIARRRLGLPLVELEGERRLDVPAFRLRARADRIDLRDGAAMAIYDYKSGRAPSARQIAQFDKQMPLEAAIALGGAWRENRVGAAARDLAAATVAALAYIPLGGPAGGRAAPLEGAPAALAAEAWAGLGRLIASYADARRPYPSRSRPMMLKDAQPYDHLARHGEWEDGEDDAETDEGARP